MRTAPEAGRCPAAISSSANRSRTPPGGKVREETGLSIRNVRFAALTNDRFEDETRHYVTVWMQGEHHAGTPTVREPHKFTDLARFDFASLPAPLFLPWKQLLASDFLVGFKSALR